MKYMVLAAAALMASTGLAGAADLTKRPPVPVIEQPPVSTFDAFVSFGLGYHSGEFESAENSGFSGEVRGSFAAALSGPLGVQVDAALSGGSNESDAIGIGHSRHHRYSTDTVIGDNEVISGTVAGHLFLRDSRVGALGLVGQYTASRTTFDVTQYFSKCGKIYASNAFEADADATNVFAGIEGQYFLGPVTAYSQVAYHAVDSDILGEGDGFTATGALRYFVTPDWMVALKGSYDTVSFDNVDKDTWTVGLRADYHLGKVANIPLNLFAEVSYADTSYDSARHSASDNDTRVMVGVTMNFDNKSLLERDRNGASFDTFKTAGSF